MPSGVELRVNIPADDVTPQGRDRLNAEEQTVAVFGTAGSVNDGTFTVTPIAVFGRIGVPGDGAGVPPRFAGTTPTPYGYG
jgi:hypothetical protein